MSKSTYLKEGSGWKQRLIYDFWERLLASQHFEHFRLATAAQSCHENRLAVSQQFTATKWKFDAQITLKRFVDPAKRLQRQARLSELTGDENVNQIKKADSFGNSQIAAAALADFEREYRAQALKESNAKVRRRKGGK